MHKIKVKNRQLIDGEVHFVEESAPCKYHVKNDKTYIIYEIENEKKKTSVMIIADKEGVTIKRTGEMNSKMEYREGSEFDFLYRMPFGNLKMTVKTEKIKMDLTESGGKIKLIYRLGVDGGNVIENDMIIRVDTLN